MFRNIIFKLKIKYLLPLKDIFNIDADNTHIRILLYSTMEQNYSLMASVRKYRNNNYINIERYCGKTKVLNDPKIKIILSESLINACKDDLYDLETIQKLIDKGADPNYNDSFALRHCCKYSDRIMVVELLIKNGADVSSCNYEALLNATKAGYLMTNIVMKYI